MMLLPLSVAALAVQAVYGALLAIGFRRATRPPAPPAAGTLPPVSVVVAARNEEHALPALLDALARQSHPSFEVIIVDDASTDGTAGVVRSRAAADPRLRLVQIADPRPPRKKHALAAGIGAARFPLLAFTDADCTPPPGWLEGLCRAQQQGPAVAAGFGPYRRRPGALNLLVRYETLVTATLMAGAIGWRRPYMAVGRNLSYPRAVFDAVGGFAHSAAWMSGDDDLFVQEVARRRAAAVVFQADAATHVPSEAPDTWSGWVRQKRRHTSAGRAYDRRVQGHLALFHASALLLWAAPLAGWAGAALLAFRLAGLWALLRRPARTLASADLLPRLPLLEGLYAAYTLFVAPLGLLRPPRRWGSRLNPSPTRASGPK